MRGAAKDRIPVGAASEMERGTKTQEDQWRVESQVFQIYDLFRGIPPNSQIAMSAPYHFQMRLGLEVHRDKHIEYLTKGLKQLSRSFTVLDANRPWLCYWILHSIALLRDCVDDKLENDCIDFLSRCQDPRGGYGGGPGQLPHLATTYAAVNSLITLGGDRSLSSINRTTLYDFLLRMKDSSGGFRMHDGGEVDVRACYTAISAASVLNILDDELIRNVGDYILSCQTYDGGIAGEPGSEAHGGYTFCGLAAMILINEVNRLDLPALINWVVFRQGIECGFQGRINKLVDGCYSFWQGGVASLIQRLNLIVNEQMGLSDTLEDCSTESDHESTSSDCSKDELSQGTSYHVHETRLLHEEVAGQSNAYHPEDVNNVGYNFIKGRVHMKPLFNHLALQQYILLCSQEEGGFRDKPGKSRDHYHTCYCLSGLSVSQYSCTKDVHTPPLPQDVLGPYSNLLERVHPLYNVVLDRYYEAHEFFTRS